MEESKVQALHDTLSKLRRSAGLGASSQYSWSGGGGGGNLDAERDDGLPTNALYANFVREGMYDPKKAASTRYGDGRKIKRNFEDCQGGSGDESDEAKKRRRKLERKEHKKAEKKKAKLEAKRRARLEEKRRLRKEAKMVNGKNSKKKDKSASDGDDDAAKDPAPAPLSSVKNGNIERKKERNGSKNKSPPCDDDEQAVRTAKKILKRQESGSMKLKELAKAVESKIGEDRCSGSVRQLIKGSDTFELDGKIVRFAEKNAAGGGNSKGRKEKKKRKRDRGQDDDDPSPEPSSSSVVSVVPSSPPPKKRRRKERAAN